MSCSLHIIIPYWHGEQYLPVCLESIEKSTLDQGVNWTVVLVHNGGALPSVPDSLKSHVKVLTTRENIGFARAVNIGLHYAKKEKVDFIALLNQDTRVHPDCFQQLLNAANTTPAFYAPVIMDYTMSYVPQWYVAKYYPNVALDPKSGIHELRIVSATCVLASRKAFEFAGDFDPAFYMYYEDDDYFDRLRSRGGRLYVVPSAQLGHFGGSTEPVVGNSMLWKRAGALKHLIRHRGLWAALRRAFRHYGSAVYRLDLKRLVGYLKSDLTSARMYGYLRRADHESIRSRALDYIASDVKSGDLR